jgi:hypothetical protein
MPFDESTPLTLNVTQDDIDGASIGITTNSLARCIKRYADNLLLPGQQYDTVSQSCGASATISPRIMNGQVVSVGEAFVCTRAYSTDTATTLIILLEALGIKPSAPYSVTLVHA